MKKRAAQIFIDMGFIIGIIFSLSVCVHAGPPENLGGWGIDAPYNQLYDASERDKIRGYVRDIKEVSPMPGMSPGVALVLDESENEQTLVHICPVWYMDQKSLGLRKGDKLKIKGVWAEINGEDIFMAAKIKRGDFFVLKVRLTKDGMPFWVMPPDQLAREKAATE